MLFSQQTTDMNNKKVNTCYLLCVFFPLQDNDSKKARAVKKANDEREMKRQKEKEIDK